MTKQNLLLLAFGVMAFLQLWLPAQTAIQHETTLRKGEAFRFETQLVDPNELLSVGGDPFRLWAAAAQDPDTERVEEVAVSLLQ